MKKIIFIFGIFLSQIFIFSSQAFSFIDPILDSKYIKDGISSTPVKIDSVQFDFQGQPYDLSTIKIGLAKLWTPPPYTDPEEPYCSKGDSYFSYTNNSIYDIIEDPTATIDEMKLNGKYFCLSIQDLSGNINYFLVASYPLNLIQQSPDSTSPQILSITTDIPSGTYGLGTKFNITLTSDDNLYNATITLTLTNGRIVTLSSVSGKTVAGSFTVGDSTSFQDDTTTLNVRSISGFLQNYLELQTLSFPNLPPTNLSTNGNIAIKTANTGPEIIILDDAQTEAYNFDFIQANVESNSSASGSLDLKYALSDTQNCTSLTGYDKTFVSGSAFQITGTGSNGKYICFRAIDSSKNTTYASTQNKLNIITSSLSSSTGSGITSTGATVSTSTGVLSSSTGTQDPGFVPPADPYISSSTGATSNVNQIVYAPTTVQNSVENTVKGTQTQSQTQIETQSQTQVQSQTQNTSSTTTNTSYVTGFIDIQDSFAKVYVEKLVDMGIVSTESNLFKPDDSITRAEFLKMLLKSQNVDYSLLPSKIDIFSDLIVGDWKMNVALKGYELGITSGYQDNTFRPDDTITRIEAIKFMLKIVSPNLEDTNSTSFLDIDEGWMKKYVNEAKKIGLVTGQNTPFGALFKPNTEMTRGEAAKIIVKALEQKK